MVFGKLHGIKLNKCHFMCIGRNTKKVVLGVKIDNKLIFDRPIIISVEK